MGQSRKKKGGVWQVNGSGSGRVGVNGSSGMSGLTSADVGDAFSILAASSEKAFNNNSNGSCLWGKPLIRHQPTTYSFI